MKEGDLGQVAQLLGHPESDIGRARDQHRVGMRLVPRRQRVRGCWREGRRASLRRPVPHPVPQPLRHRRARHRLGGADDRRIAGAAAEIAGKAVVVVGPPVQMRRRHRHHEARRAEAALAAVMRDQRRLHRVHLARGPRQPLDGADRAAVQLRQEQDAGVQRPRSPVVGHHHRAGAAVALVAALFGAGQPTLLAQPVEQRPCR